MKYYLLIIFITFALIYRILKYHTFFKKRISSFEINKLIIKVDNHLFMFIFFSTVLFYSIEIFDKLILFVFILTILTFFRIEKVN